ncbi:MAG TPA: hypothetical protein VGH37_02685 [Candidatus Acidoferrum sp.]|jgi:hypothetical protein
MEVRLVSSDVDQQSFAAKSKVLYRAGHQYCRTEEAPDAPNGIHGLVIINEPNAWLINLETKTGQHFIDPGPTFNCRLQIFAPIGTKDAPDMLTNDLEFGRELEFFQKLGNAQAGPTVQGKETSVYIVEIGTTALGLPTYGTPERPLTISRKYGNHTEIFWYDNYEDVSFDSKLFVIPEGITMEEVKTHSQH